MTSMGPDIRPALRGYWARYRKITAARTALGASQETASSLEAIVSLEAAANQEAAANLEAAVSLEAIASLAGLPSQAAAPRPALHRAKASQARHRALPPAGNPAAPG